MKHLIACCAVFALLFWTQNIDAQVVFEPGTPISLDKSLKDNVPVEVMTELDYDKLALEDNDILNEGQPFRFGYIHDVNFNLNNSGVWETLPSGDRVWRLTIVAPKALTINLNYSTYNLAPYGKLYVYGEETAAYLGPFTKANEKSDGNFATGFTYGNRCTIEYIEPAKMAGQGQLEISGVVHGYNSINHEVENVYKAFQGSGSCNYDVGCTISAGWEDQIKSVGLLLTSNNSRFCTGALINNTGNDCKAYFLSANHCFASDNVGDVLTDIVMFNYNSPTPACPGTPTSDGITNQTVQGATVVAKASSSDFCLLELTNNPIDFYDVYYSGWSRANSGFTNNVAIHHPSGDVKKFSTDADAPISSTYTNTTGSHWQVGAWEEGTTEPGSSGSPLFNQNMQIIGQLHGGTASCSQPGAPDYYGKIWYSWDQNAGATAQLKPWLDPINSGAIAIGGSNCSTPMPPVAALSPATGSSYEFCTSGTINFNDLSTFAPTNWSWSFSGAGVSPTFSTAQNPSVTVSTSGTLNVALIVSNAQGTDAMTHTYNITITNCVENSYCNTTSLDIPDNDPNGVQSSLVVPANNIITDLNVEVDLPHTWVGDLFISLAHNGTTVTLMDQPGVPASQYGCNQDNVLATFDDEAVVPVETACGTSGSGVGGFVIPEAALSVFDGMDQAGTWTLFISDAVGQDLGTLENWCINVTSDASSDCYSMLTNGAPGIGLQNTETGVADYESSDWIETTSGVSTIMQSGSSVDYDAAQYIQLNDGFEVQLGANFHGFIDGCDNGGGGMNRNDVDPTTIKESNSKN